MKRRFLLLAILLAFLCALVLPGCNPAPASTPQTTAPQTTPTTTAPEPTEPNPFVTVYMLTGRTCTVDGADGAGTLTFVYDDAGRIVEVTMDEAVVVTYTYDEQGNCLAYKNILEGIDQTYDTQGRTLTEQTAEGLLTYTYDEAGRCTQVETHGADGTLLSTTRYTFNEQGHLLSEVLEQDGSIYSEILHTYDEAGNHLTQTYYRNGEVSPDGPSYEWTYDDYSRLEAEYIYYGETLFQGTVFAFDSRAHVSIPNITWRNDGYFCQYTFMYDNEGSLRDYYENSRNPDGSKCEISQSYLYDTHGNTVYLQKTEKRWQGDDCYLDQRITYQWSYDAGGTVMTGCSLTSPEESYEYAWTFDDNGRKVMEIRAGDNPHQIGWEYDRLGKLLFVIAGGSVVYKETYTYDEQGNLIQLQREADGVTTVISYSYTAVSVLPEVAAQLQAQQHSLLEQVIQANTGRE